MTPPKLLERLQPKKGAAAAKAAPAKKAPLAKKAAPAKAAPAKKAPAKAAPAKKALAKKAPPAKAAPAKKAAAKKAPAKAAPAKKAPAKKAALGPYADDPKFLAEQRELLLAERAEYQAQADDLRAEAEELALEREPGDVQFDEESGEGGTIAVDRERDLALSAQAMSAIEEIDEALAAVSARTYGSCEHCHQPIPKARLKALPYARLCVACKSGGLHRR